MNPASEPTGREKALVQGLDHGSVRQVRRIVAMSGMEVMNENGCGRAHSLRQTGLADGLWRGGYFDDATTRRELAKIKKAKVMRYATVFDTQLFRLWGKRQARFRLS